MESGGQVFRKRDSLFSAGARPTARGLISTAEVGGAVVETGPNAILLSDVAVQKGLRSDHRMKYFAIPAVRASVAKKLSKAVLPLLRCEGSRPGCLERHRRTRVAACAFHQDILIQAAEDYALARAQSHLARYFPVPDHHMYMILDGVVEVLDLEEGIHGSTKPPRSARSVRPAMSRPFVFPTGRTMSFS